MKKKLLFCIHNYFFLQHYILDLKKLEEDYEITILTSNYQLENQKKNKEDFLNKLNIKDIFFIPFYKIGLERTAFTILSTHIYLLKLKQLINFSEFDICVTDSKFFIWERIIIDKFLSKNCKKIGVSTSSISLDLLIFKKLIIGENIEKYISKLHKLRKYNPEKRIPEKNFYKKIVNVKKRFLDIFFDRKFLSYLFYFQNFNYKEKDLKILETDNFDYKVLFHYSNFIFWRNIYKKKENVIFAKHANNCGCQNGKKNKFLFLSSVMWGEEKDEILKQINLVINFYKIKTKDINDTFEIHIKHHPEESIKVIEKINFEFKRNFPKNVKIVFIDKLKLLSDIACNYSIVFGMMSTALVDVKNSCKFVEVYCLKSISTKEYGNDYFLKLLNEDIIFYDDFKDAPDENLNLYKRYIKNHDKIDFAEFIRSI
tara:strand:+ start:16 stop:1296 length:1281 start_codon:yes stop_codon:yes gene_type:complete